MKLVKSNQQGNAVIEKKQKLKKSKLIAQIDNSQKKKTHSTRNETKLSPQRRTVGKNKKNTALKGKQESLKNTRQSDQKKHIRSGQDQGSIEKKKVTHPRTSQRRKSVGCKSPKDKSNTALQKDRNRVTVEEGSTNKKTRRNLHDDFTNMFLKKVEVKSHILVGVDKRISGISVTHDNQVWVTSQHKHVKLFSASGDEIRSFNLDYPVFTCCTQNGDLLVTRGYGEHSRAEIQLIPREGTGRVFADLSSYADTLCGVCYQDGKIYVIGNMRKSSKHFILKLDMNGEVEEVIKTTDSRHMNHIISHHGQIIVMCTFKFAMLPIVSGKISSKAISRVHFKNYFSASASVDNLGNVIVASGAKIIVIDASLERMFKICTDMQESITATAVDQLNQLWIGTEKGNLYIVKYLQ